MNRIAIVGMACRYPDADTPRDLWENSLAGRRAFRRLPDVRMNLADYWDPDPGVPDRFYARTAAVIEGYEFDRIGHKIAGSTYRSTDLTHWLALDTAGRALADAGFPGGEGLPRERTAVIVGNTLTGEFTRANTMRLRWPYVRRVVAAALREHSFDDDRLADLLASLETAYKSPFPPVNEDTLAGGLSNTIAGRVCNHFDLGGGGYTVDGACSSSLLSVTQAARSLLDGDIDVAVTGGVDLSIDPFEIVGFAKTGALATHEMRVYDRHANGFWPGEGCGMVVLMREGDALAAGHRVYATIAGWGISSDGQGGITRPEAHGYRLALRRAYDRAGFGIETVGLFEGHGTGTEVGDTTELGALSQARADADPRARPAAISSVKAIIGHTKAAAGVAGLIKAALAVDAETLPPAVGCHDPHPLLGGDAPALRVLRRAEAWPQDTPVRAGITAMGFGGINTHVVLDQPAGRTTGRGRTAARPGQAPAPAVQDAELLLVDGDTPEALRERLAHLAGLVPKISYAELGDLAATLQRDLRDAPHRAAAVVSSPDEAERRLTALVAELDAGRTRHLAADGRAFLGRAGGPARIGYLFPGQGSGRGTSGGALARRMSEAEEVYTSAALPTGTDTVATEVAQPRIVTGSMAGLRALQALGLDATVAVGHSLGEISALAWAGALDQDLLIEVARMRGRTMSEYGVAGTMVSLAATPERARALADGLPVAVAGHNAPERTVLAGTVDAVTALEDRARAAGIAATRLAVSHAFHSPLVARAAQEVGACLVELDFRPIARRVVSTVTGDDLAAGTDIPRLLRRQITEPVLFAPAVARAAQELDLLIEVGPGRVLSGLAAAVTDVPALALDTDDESLHGLLHIAGAAYVLGAPLDHARLFRDRLVRPLDLAGDFRFFASPAESAPLVDVRATAPATVTATSPAPAEETPREAVPESAVDLLRRLVAERAELPPDTVGPGTRLLDDLHLSSITVGQLVGQAAQLLGLPPSAAPLNFATATIGELGQALQETADTGHFEDPAAGPAVAGAAAWARAFAVDLDELPRPARSAPEDNGPWEVFAPAGHPFAETIRQRLENASVGPGVLLCLPPGSTEEDLGPALAAARRALTDPAARRFALVQHDKGATALAKTLHLEDPRLRTTVVRLPADISANISADTSAGISADAVDRIAAEVTEEVAATSRFSEVHFSGAHFSEGHVDGAHLGGIHHDATGTRTVPTLRPLPIAPARTEQPLGAGDVLLVTGGGKGITAECALAVARDSGAALAVLGRSDPAADEELAANLRRMADSGVTVRYARADVTDPGAVRAAVDRLTAGLGPVTAVLHGAGRNEPAALAALDRDTVRRTFAPKIDGLRTVLDAVDPGALRLLVTFGSIIGRAGLRGEAHYALANDWLADLTEEIARDHPGCRALCLEWSVWSGVGMGERLSVVESLTRDGVTPLTPDQGVALLRRLLADPDTPTVTVISGRTEGIGTVRRDQPPLPLLRFADKPLVRYHGVELVTEAELSAGTDPYLADHHLDGNLLFPAVIGMEAMAQVAAACTGRTTVPVIEDAAFPRPVIVPPGGSTTIRIATVVTGPDTVDAVIHSEETGFAAEHFRARFRFGATPVPQGAPEQVHHSLPAVPLTPLDDLYGGILFQGGRFRRLRHYHRAAARHVDAVVATSQTDSWFAGFLPGDLLLGDPGMRDALMHGNQVCVPHATLLPQAIDRIHPCGDKSAAGELRYTATERHRDGDTYTYDIAVRTGDGEVVERWEGLRLRAVRKGDGRGPWPAVPLLGPYLERTVEELTGTRVAVAVEPDGDGGGNGGGDGDRRARTAAAAQRALGRPVTIRYRPDGRPEPDTAGMLSASHCGDFTLCAVADPAGTPATEAPTATTVACDAETVTARPAADWDALLGDHAPLARLIARETGDTPDTAATRVWTALECLQKAGLTAAAPLALAPGPRDGWAVLTSGGLRIATLATSVGTPAVPTVLTILTEGRSHA
ncbi:type I polyketide synthase [Streptomyces yaizuensis]|uniref:SDR family NAD(P)-dependent oxidoreductase n=1 Tax=Streptomyces yaizuensis TaxID=2989713 RepID=A0ABQ5P869_9ACTN|nr:type I polyketide synthase [Streptomyces sp. YSPA8]GLF98792.1 SDR family NAD(P)-dependent oxidoreductase [Streptomyces sp. YSPA8]